MPLDLQETIEMSYKQRIKLIFKTLLKEKAKINTNTCLQAQIKHIMFHPEQYPLELQNVAHEAFLIEMYIYGKQSSIS